MIRTETEYSREGLIIARDYERCLTAFCKHVSNDRYYGQPFALEPFQRENIWKPLFACGEMREDGFNRRFRRAIFGLPSGYGKTELAAALLLTIATMEPIFNGQYGLVASSLDQVQNVFEKIATMIKLDSTLSSQWEILKGLIQHKETGARIMVLPNKASALESWHFNVLVFDELHVYRDDGVWNAGVKGQKVLNNPLTIGITTAGDARDGFLWNTLEQSESDSGMFLYWLGLDDSDDIDDAKAWEKMMVASWVTPESIADQRGSATSPRSFERYTANRFPLSKSERAAFTSAEVEACVKRSGKINYDDYFTVGIDGAVSRDTFAIVAYQRQGESDVFEEWTWDEPDESGYYPMFEIADVIEKLGKHRPLILCDPARLTLMSQYLERERGVKIYGFAQNDKNMCPASETYAHSIHTTRACLASTPVLAAHSSNCIEDAKKAFGFRFTSTGTGSRKRCIDAAIAASMAMYGYDNIEPPRRYNGGIYSFDL